VALYRHIQYMTTGAISPLKASNLCDTPRTSARRHESGQLYGVTNLESAIWVSDQTGAFIGSVTHAGED